VAAPSSNERVRALWLHDLAQWKLIKKWLGLHFALSSAAHLSSLCSRQPARKRGWNGGAAPGGAAAFPVNTTTNLNEKRTHKNAVCAGEGDADAHSALYSGVCALFFLGRMGVHVFMTLHYFFIMIILFFFLLFAPTSGGVGLL